MAKVRQEDLQMKIPALLHLSRLGYGYLSRMELQKRDRRINVFPDTLRAAIERINHVRISSEQFARLMEELYARLDAEDLGRQFYGMIRDGWNGFRLIDYEHPECNLFQTAAELACGNGAGSFRPDITLYLNGFPLAMIEMKARDQLSGLQAEYDRMQKRFRSKAMRRYLQCTQIWAFSDKHADEQNQLTPTKGTFFATAMTEDFPVYAVRAKSSAVYGRLKPLKAEEEQRILEDNGVRVKPHTRAFQRDRSSGKPLHRMLTALFQPERFLFLLRYGIRYVQETDPEGKEYLTRRMLTNRQLTALETLIRKADRGYRNWTVPSQGAAGEKAANTSMITLLRELFPEAKLYWASANDAEQQRDREALESCGISCAQPQKAAGNQLILIRTDGDPETWLQEPGECDFTGRRVFILPQPVFRYGQKTGFSARLRRMDPNAVLVTRKTNQVPEGGFSAILLRMKV